MLLLPQRLHSQPWTVQAWPTHVDVHLPLPEKLLMVGTAQVLLAAYQYYFVRRFKHSGLTRLIASLPTILVLLTFTTFFDWHLEVMLRVATLFTCSWLGTFKVVGACINRGPLAQDEQRTFLQFYMLMYLPIFPSFDHHRKSSKLKGRLHDTAQHPALLLLFGICKTALLLGVVWSVKTYDLPDMMANYLYALALVGFLGVLMDAPASLATSLVGLTIIPTFDQPWFASSLADWWGRRWNITTSAILRTVIYDPIIEGVLVKPHHASAEEHAHANKAEPSNGALQTLGKEPAGPATASAALSNGSTASTAPPQHPRVAKWRRVAGTFATFGVSGIVHEYILNMVIPPLPDGRMPWMWKWTAFFTLQAPLLLAEVKLKKWWRQHGLPQPNIWLARLLTMWVLLTVAGPLFFAPCVKDSDLRERCIQAVTTVASGAWQAVKPLAQSVLGGLSSAAGQQAAGSAGQAALHTASEL